MRVTTIKQARAVKQQYINTGLEIFFLRLTNDIPNLGLRKGQIYSTDGLDVVTNSFNIGTFGVGSNIHLQKDLNCKLLF